MPPSRGTHIRHEVTDEPFLEPTEKGEVWVYPARINCNLKSLVLLRERDGREGEGEREEGKGERERKHTLDAALETMAWHLIHV